MFLLDAFSGSTFITSILTGGIISGVLTWVSSYHLKKNEIAWNYQTYILEKRKQAYDLLTNLF